MTKKFILNIALNLAIFFLILSGVASYRSGNALFLGLSIALFIVLVYLKIVLLKQVSREAKAKAIERTTPMSPKTRNKKRKK